MGNDKAAGPRAVAACAPRATTASRWSNVLKAAFVQDRLTKDEFDDRVGQALASRTYADLTALTADLPAEPDPGAGYPAAGYPAGRLTPCRPASPPRPGPGTPRSGRAPG